MESEAKYWGGPRKGAGRKPGPNTRVSLSVPREVWAQLIEEAAKKGISPEAHATELLRAHAAAPLFTLPR